MSAAASEKSSHIAWVYVRVSIRSQTLLAADLRMRGEFRQCSKKACRTSE
jgi:hypothetical protein